MKNDMKPKLSDIRVYVDASYDGCGYIHAIWGKVPVADFIAAYLEYLEEANCENGETLVAYNGIPVGCMRGEFLLTYYDSLSFGDCEDIVSIMGVKPYDICTTQSQGYIFELIPNAVCCTKNEWSVTDPVLHNAHVCRIGVLPQRGSKIPFYDLDSADSSHTHILPRDCYYLVSNIDGYHRLMFDVTRRICDENKSALYPNPNKHISGLTDIDDVMNRVDF